MWFLVQKVKHNDQVVDAKPFALDEEGLIKLLTMATPMVATFEVTKLDMEHPPESDLDPDQAQDWFDNQPYE